MFYYAFDGAVLFLHVIYVGVVFGVVGSEPAYLKHIDFAVKVFMSLFLLWRFNPWTAVRFTEFDRRVVFSAGMFLFTVTIVNRYLVEYVAWAKATARSLRLPRLY